MDVKLIYSWLTNTQIQLECRELTTVQLTLLTAGSSILRNIPYLFQNKRKRKIRRPMEKLSCFRKARQAGLVRGKGGTKGQGKSRVLRQ